MEELKAAGSGPAELVMGTDLTIANAASILKTIREALAKTDHLVITVRDHAEVDVSFLQILCAAHRTAAGQNKCFRLNTEKTRALQVAARAAGYVRIKGCSRDRDGSCLWKRGQI